MPMLQAPRKISRRQELRQDAVVNLSTRAVDFYEDHQKLLIWIGVGIAALIALGFAYNYYQGQQEIKAAELLGGIVGIYESGDYRTALDGTEDKPGLLHIADEYSGTPDGNLANFYAADALFNLDEKEQALTYFRAYDKGRDFLGASALAGEAAILSDQENFAAAADKYAEAAEVYANQLTSPPYLLDAARNYEKAGDYRSARRMYDTIKTTYPESSIAGGLDIYLARIDALEK